VLTSGQSTVTGLNDPSKGSILSTSMDATPVQAGGKLISGDISLVNPTGKVQLSSGISVGGTSNQSLIQKEHVHKGVPDPRFPDVDTSVYSAFATNTYTPGMTILDNVRIPAGTNPTFNGNSLIRGVLYIETPNRVSFGGNTTVQGMIVVQNDTALNTSTNVIDFSGSVVHQQASTLPESFGDVRKLDGVFCWQTTSWSRCGATSGWCTATSSPASSRWAAAPRARSRAASSRRPTFRRPSTAAPT